MKKPRDVIDAAEDLIFNAGIDLTAGGGIIELQQFQDYLKDYKITVYNDRSGRFTYF